MGEFAVDVVVPDLGDAKDVEVIELLAAPGDQLEPEAPLISLETDKATMDVPCPVGGSLVRVTVGVGDRVNTGDVIAVIEPTAAVEVAAPTQAAAPAAAAAELLAPTPPSAATRPSAAPTQAPRASSAQPRPLPPIDETSFGVSHASPSVRKLARELGVSLGQVRGRGRKGRITAEDVKDFVKAFMLTGGSAGSALPEVPVVDFARFGEIEQVPLSRIQQISGPRLHASWVNLPHVTQHDLADITALEEARRALKSANPEVKVTPLALIMRALVLALTEFPAFRSSLAGDGKHLVIKHHYHLGFAADTPNGLVVPVIRDVDKKSVLDIAAELIELSARARAGQLRANDMQGGVFTVSSLGGIGGTYFTPIINAPEVAILGVSRSSMQPVWDGKQFGPRLMLPLSLSYDHRVIDGAQAARFITKLGQLLADPESWSRSEA